MKTNFTLSRSLPLLLQQVRYYLATSFKKNIGKTAFLLCLGLATAVMSMAQPSGWGYKKDIRITNAEAIAVTDYQLKLTLNTQELISAGQLKADGSDLRFGKDETGATLFPHYIESGINTSATIVWVRIDEIPASARKTFYMYYGNASAAKASALNTFFGPHSATDSVPTLGLSGSSNAQRGFRFAAKEDILVTSFGKNEPDGSTRYITLFDFASQQKLKQIQVSGPAATYSYAPLDEATWLQKDKQYLLEMYQAVGAAYYFGSSTQIGEHLTYMDMRYCNGCDQNTFPTNVLGGMHYGLPDLHYYTKNNTIAQPFYEFGPFLTVTPSSLPNGKVGEAYNQTLTATEGIAPYTYEVTAGTLPAGLLLSSNGSLTGTITSAGTFNFTVMVTDATPGSVANTVTKSYDLVVEKAVQSISFASLPNKTYGDAPFTLSATSTAGLPVTYSVVSGPVTIQANKITITGAGVVSIAVNQGGNDNYNAALQKVQNFTVNKKAATVKANDQTKIYGAANPALTVSYTGLVNNETSIAGISVSTTAGKASGAGNYPITASGTSDNYVITFHQGTLSIGKRDVLASINAAVAITKEYDGNNMAVITEDHYKLEGAIEGDELFLTGEANYDNKNAGTDKNIVFNDIELQGEKKDNYNLVLATQTVTGTITPKEIGLQLLESPAVTKVYDGNSTASLQAGNYKLEGVLEGDDLSVSGTAHYDNKNAGTGKKITVNEFVLSGTSRNNYSLIGQVGPIAGSITQKPIAVSLSNSNAITKVYDGTDIAILKASNYQLQGVVGDDDVSISSQANYSNKNAGDDKTITAQHFVLSGETKDNYSLITQLATTTGNITPKQLNASVITDLSITKEYDGNNNIALGADYYLLEGKVAGDDLSVSAQAFYDNANAGVNKTVTVSNFVLDGEMKNNYHLIAPAQTVKGDITAKQITVKLQATPAITKVYDGTGTALLETGNYKLDGLIEGDEVSVSGDASYENRNAGTGKTITVNDFVLSGGPKANYSLTTHTATTTGNITPKQLTVSLVNDAVITKVYDGTSAASLSADNYKVTGIVSEDEVVLNNPASGAYNDQHAGESKEVTVSGLAISGGGAANYTLASVTVSANIGTITRKEVSVTAIAKSKIYGAADPEVTYNVIGLVGNDQLSGSLHRTSGNDAGQYTISIGSLSGGNDYTISSFTPASFTITPASLTITVENKTRVQGSANPVFTFSYDGLVNGDTPADLTAGPQAQTVAVSASPIGYYDVVASGASSPNYTISYIKGVLTVIPNGKNYVKAWSSTPDVMQIRIYSEKAQKASIILYTETGQRLVIQPKNLVAGINSYTLDISRYPSAIYILHVAAEKFKESHRMRIK